MRMLVNSKPYPIKTRLSAVDICVLVFGTVLSLILFLFPSGNGGQTCLVTWDEGETTLPLFEQASLTVESRGYTLTIVVENGKVRVSETTCPDALCRSVGEISTEGEIIVCVPAGVVIRIPKEKSAGEDYIVG